MKSLLFFLALLAAAPWSGAGEVQLRARVYLVEPDAEEPQTALEVGFIDEHLLIVSEGKVSASVRGRQFVIPADYHPPRLGRGVVALLEDAAAWESFVDPKVPANVIIPEVPASTETRNAGLSFEAQLVRDEKGRLQVEVGCEDLWFHSFGNSGESLVAKRKGALGKEKLSVLSGSRQPEPLIEPWWEVVRVAVDGGETIVEIPARVELHRPARLLVLEATRLGLSPALTSRGTEPALVSSRTWAVGDELRLALPGEESLTPESAPDRLKALLAGLGIPARSVAVDADWNLVVEGEAGALDRVESLLALYRKEPQIHLTAKFVEVEEPLDLNILPVLSDPEFQRLIRSANQATATDIMSAPSVVTRSGRRAKIEVIREFIHPSGIDPPVVGDGSEAEGFSLTPPEPSAFAIHNVGVTLEVEPLLYEDGTIGLTLSPGLLEFEGLVNYGSPTVQFKRGMLGRPQVVTISENRVELPVFFQRRVTSSVRIPDGATVAVGGLAREQSRVMEDKIPFLGDVPVIGAWARTKEEQTSRKFVYAFVTATLIDPAGVPLDADKDSE